MVWYPCCLKNSGIWNESWVKCGAWRIRKNEIWVRAHCGVVCSDFPEVGRKIVDESAVRTTPSKQRGTRWAAYSLLDIVFGTHKALCGESVHVGGVHCRDMRAWYGVSPKGIDLRSQVVHSEKEDVFSTNRCRRGYGRRREGRHRPRTGDAIGGAGSVALHRLVVQDAGICRDAALFCGADKPADALTPGLTCGAASGANVCAVGDTEVLVGVLLRPRPAAACTNTILSLQPLRPTPTPRQCAWPGAELVIPVSALQYLF
jgi:hypothetical protein